MLQIVAALAIFCPTVSVPTIIQTASPQDERVSMLLRETINHGADLYNRGDANGCYRLYEGTLMAVSGLVQDRPEWQNWIDQGLAVAATKPQVAQRAFVLREAMNRIREDATGIRWEK